MWWMLARDPVSKLSTQITRCPRRRSSSHRCDPRKPAPPVTRQVAIRALRIPSTRARGLQALLGQHLDEHVAAVVAPFGEPVVGQPPADDRAPATARPRFAAALLRLDHELLRHPGASVAAILLG